MDISDIDIYDDLDEFQEKEEKKSAELLALEAKYKESLETIELMNVEMKTLRKQQRIMEVNFQNLLDTAKTELKRKNGQIAQLQREKDDICFRRKHANTGIVAGATHKQFGDGAGTSASFSHYQQANPFKQNAIKATTVLEHEITLSKTDSATTQLPAECLPATNTKRQLSPIDSDESWKERKKHPFKQNATKATTVLEHETTLSKTDSATTQLPAECLPATNSKRPLSPIDSDESWKERKKHPFKQNATKATTVLEHETTLLKTDSATTQLPAECLPATNSKRQLSPIDSDESWKETDNVEPRNKTLMHKKSRFDKEQNSHRRTHSDSDKDEEAATATKRERSHSRGRNYRSHLESRSSSRYKYNKSQRSSDTEDRYSDYHRERKRDRKSERDHDHYDRRRRKSREGRQRERRDSDHDRKHRKASRTDLDRVEKTKYFKKVARGEESSGRSSSRKESLHKTEAHENSKESNNKSFNKKYESHENEYERKTYSKERTEVNKKALHHDQKDCKYPFLEKYKIPKIEHEEKYPVHKELKRERKEMKLYSPKDCISIDDSIDEIELDALPNTSADRNSKQCKNYIETNLLADMEAISENNLSNSSSDTIIFETSKKTSVNNSSDKIDNDAPKEKSFDVLNTPKKVALFNTLFGQQAGNDTTTNKSSILLNNVLEILKTDTTKNALDVNNKNKKSKEELSPDLSKKSKDGTDKCVLNTQKSEFIVRSSKSNLDMSKHDAKNINKEHKDALKNPAEERIFKKNEIIEIEDDTSIYSTDEEIQFFNIDAEPKHSNITKPSSANLENTTHENVSETKVDKTKKPVIEIIEDIRLPSVLPIKQILRIHEETCAQEQQVVANKNTENLPLLLEDGNLQSKENIEYSPNITAFNTDDELDISDQTEIIFDETNMSLEVASDDQLSDLEDIKENNVNDAQASNHFEKTNTFRTTEHLTANNKSISQQQKSLNNNTIELKNTESKVINKVLDSDIQTTECKKAQAREDADAIIDIDIDEDCAEQQEKEKHEQQKQEITLSTKEKTNEAIDSNINTFDIQSEEELQDNFTDKIVPVADISEDIKATLNKKNFVENTLTDVQLLAESSGQHISKEKTDEIISITSSDDQLTDVISDNPSNLSKFGDEGQVEENKIVVNDEQSSVINDNPQVVDKSTEHTSTNEVVDVISTDRDIDVAHKNIIHKNIENMSFTIASEKMELTTLTDIILNKPDDITKSIDKIENIVEVEKRLVEEFENKTDDEKDIKTKPDQNTDAAKDSKNFDTKEVICDKLRKEDVAAILNNDNSDNHEENPDEQAKNINSANISIAYKDNNEEIKCVSEKEDLSENNKKKEESLSTDEVIITDIEIDAEIKEIAVDLEVGLIEIEANIKELQAVAEINEKNNNEIEETLNPEVLSRNSKKDVIKEPKTALNNNDVLSERKTLVPGDPEIILNKEFKNNIKETSKNEAHLPHSRHFSQVDRVDMEKQHKENKAYENFKKSVASKDRRGRKKSQLGMEEDINRSKTAIENLTQPSNASEKIPEHPKAEVVLSAKDLCADDKHQKELLLKEENVPHTKQQNESKPKTKPEDVKIVQQSVQALSPDSGDDNKQSAHEMDNKDSAIETSSNKGQLDTTNQAEQINKSTDQTKNKTFEAEIVEDVPKNSDLKFLKHTQANKVEPKTITQEIAINQLRELSAIVGPDEKYYIPSDDEKPFSPKVLPRHSSSEKVQEKQPSKKPPSKTKNFFKILVAPKVESRKRKLPAGYKIPKVKQPKLDIDEPIDKEITKNAPKPTAVNSKEHKENLLNKKKYEKKEGKMLSTVKNRTKINSTKTDCCPKKTTSENVFGEDEAKINIPNNNQASTSCITQNKYSNNLESKAPVQTHKLELCDPRNPFYSTMDTIKVDKIKQKVNEKLLEAQPISADSENQAQAMSTANVNAHCHSELNPTTNNIESKVSPNTPRPASKASSKIANQTKSKRFRRILDSSSDDEISDDHNIYGVESRLNTVDLQPTAANLITPNHELKRKKTKRRVVRVTTIDEPSRTASHHEIPAPPAPICAPPTPILAPPAPILAPPTPDHAIFHTEPESSSLYAESALPQFTNLQDKQYTDIDSRLQSMFQSPPYVADHQMTAVSEHLLSPLQYNASMSPPPLENKSLNDSSSNKSASNLESKRLSLGTSQYVVEKVSENVVNVFITRKRHKKKNTLLPTNKTAKPELLTSAIDGDIA